MQQSFPGLSGSYLRHANQPLSAFPEPCEKVNEYFYPGCAVRYCTYLYRHVKGKGEIKQKKKKKIYQPPTGRRTLSTLIL